MNANTNDESMKYMRLLAEKYPSERAVTREIINLTAIRNLPKGTEHFMSDLHGEYEAFCHILNNCSGVIREKLTALYGDSLGTGEIKDLCTLIYYPAEKLRLCRREQLLDREWYRTTLGRMIEVARVLSSKYTRSKVRKAMPSDYAYILDELLHAQKDEDDNQLRYHAIILDTVITIAADDFLISLAGLIKRLAVDHLHIVGDIYDRGDSAERILDLLMTHHSLDIEWGNHDILWMGAASGCDACIAGAVRNCIAYKAIRTLENGYGISLRKLVTFARDTYPDTPPMKAALQAITVIQFKLEGQIILRNPDYHMEDRLLLDKMDLENGTITIDDKVYRLNTTAFPTVDMTDPYALNTEEAQVVDDLRDAFLHSEKLQQHTAFLYDVGGMYKIYNGNLLYHGCVPLNDDGTLREVEFFGEKFSGKAYFDMADTIARHAFYSKRRELPGLDFLWYLRCGENSPLNGRKTKGFERAYIDDESAWSEPKNPYYIHYYRRDVCEMILSEFGLDPQRSHIINGHTPVRTTRGELPIRADGKLMVIDGGFCERYHAKTGIAGYTLIYNSHGLRLKAHRPFSTIEDVLTDNRDIKSVSEIVETAPERVMVDATDAGADIKEQIDDLYALLALYRSGTLLPREN